MLVFSTSTCNDNVGFFILLGDLSLFTSGSKSYKSLFFSILLSFIIIHHAIREKWHVIVKSIIFDLTAIFKTQT